MNVLILGGNSPRHKTWVRDLAATIASHFDKVVYLDYAHWDVADGTADIATEARTAAKLAASLGDYVIVAKSIGTVITIRACAEGLLHPKRCVFLGFPLSIVQKEHIDLAEKLHRLPSCRFVQNTYDPLGSFEDVSVYIQEHDLTQMSLVQTPGDTHDYTDFEFIADLAQAA